MALLNYSLNKLERMWLTLPIVYIINYSIINGTIRDEFKVARIVLIHKKWYRTDCSLLTSSLVVILAKILGKTIKTLSLNYLKMNKIIQDSKYRFRKILGTKNTLIDLSNIMK